MASTSATSTDITDLTILYASIDLLREELKITERELTGLAERITTELCSAQSYTEFQSQLVDILLAHHRQILEQYKNEQNLQMVLYLKLFKVIERGRMKGTLSTANKRISMNKSAEDDEQKIHENTLYTQ
eukprot:1013477_1